MGGHCFWKLYTTIEPFYPVKLLQKKIKQKVDKIYQQNFILTSLQLSIAIRYFAGASPYDLMYLHVVGYN